MSDGGARRSRGLLIVLLLAIAVAAAGTMLWIAGILRPAPAIPPAPVVATAQVNGVLTLTLAAGHDDPIDRAAETIRQTARMIAAGRLPAPAPRTLVFDIRAEARPLMQLVYDPGVLAAGAVAGASADHILDLAGQGSAPPHRDDPALTAYCGRIETGTRPFCKAATAG